MIFHCVRVCVCTHIHTYSSPLNNMSLNCESPLRCGFFSTNTVLAFSLYKSLKFVWLEVTVGGTKRIRVWVPTLCKLFEFSSLGWIIYQFLHFWERDTNNSDFYLTGGLAPVIPYTVQGLAVYLTISLSVLLSTDTCFGTLARMNNAPVSMGVQTYF